VFLTETGVVDDEVLPDLLPLFPNASLVVTISPISFHFVVSTSICTCGLLHWFDQLSSVLPALPATPEDYCICSVNSRIWPPRILGATTVMHSQRLAVTEIYIADILCI